MAALLDDAALLRRLIAFDTTSDRSNLPLCAFLEEYLDRPGIVVARQLSPDGRKANLVAVVGELMPERSGLTLAGHTDVVPATEPEWESDPFDLRDTGERFVGRGTCDMKGFVALAVNTLARAASWHLRRPLALLLTYDEELGTRGAREFVERSPLSARLPVAALVGEPTELRVVNMHKGILEFWITIKGRAAHSAYPHLGYNAIEPAARAIAALADLRATLESERPLYAERFADVPFVTLNVGRIAGGRAVNVVPDECRIGVTARPLPEISCEAVLERVRRVVAPAVSGAVWELEVVSEAPPLSPDPDGLLARELCSMLGQPAPEAVSYATDAGWLSRRGYRCVVCGPGSIRAAHQPNEWLARSAFAAARDLLDRLVASACT